LHEIEGDDAYGEDLTRNIQNPNNSILFHNNSLASLAVPGIRNNLQMLVDSSF